VEVTTRTLGGHRDGGSPIPVRIDTRTKDGASKQTEWVVVGWDALSRTVWTVVLFAPLDLATGWQEALRIEGPAAERISAAP
jgi:hypothetical protein